MFVKENPDRKKKKRLNVEETLQSDWSIIFWSIILRTRILWNSYCGKLQDHCFGFTPISDISNIAILQKSFKKSGSIMHNQFQGNFQIGQTNQN